MKSRVQVKKHKQWGMEELVKSKRKQMGEKDRRKERGQRVTRGRKQSKGERGQSRKENQTREERLQKRWRRGGSRPILRRGTRLRGAKGNKNKGKELREVMTGHLCGSRGVKLFAR